MAKPRKIDGSLTPSAQILLQWLQMQFREPREVLIISQARLMAVIGCQRVTVFRALRELQANRQVFCGRVGNVCALSLLPLCSSEVTARVFLDEWQSKSAHDIS